MVIDLASTYVLLDSTGSSSTMDGGDAFWSQPRSVFDAIGRSWLVSEYVFTADWPNWEVHPEADELVYVLEGEVKLQLELPAGLQEHHIRDRGAVVIPRGVWHTARVLAPCRMLHITMGAGTQSRPAAA